ncbi:MAG TPA: hypothetical protein VHM69_19280 [Rubrobacter sp.]|nr:hypothetical protein [Rubrobacter sp.]
MGGKHKGPFARVVAIIVVLAGLSVIGACGADTVATKDQSSRDAAVGSKAAEGEGGSKTIPQPVMLEDLATAPEGARVDISMPVFSNPTEITNPLFPVSKQESVLMVGRVDDKPFRTEVTLLPETRIIEWQGQRVETLVSQYTAYLDGRIHEIAYDLYAQADDGSVWYFGEDVFNFEDGAIANTEGTWIAGKDGPAAMIMPSEPKMGDVYRPENIPGFVFEEVTVKSVGKTLEGPMGPVDGGLVVEELHMDNTKEGKTFAPGYGEFYTAGGGDVEALALAIPTDALSGPTPAELDTLSSGALEVFDAAESEDWEGATTTVEEMNAAWKDYREGEVPKKIEPRMSAALADLTEAVEARDTKQTSQAAIDAAQWSLDLRLQFRPQAEIDLARFDLWAAQLTLDAAAGDANAVRGDVFTLGYIRDRIMSSLDGADATRVNTAFMDLQVAAGEDDLAAASDAAEQLRNTLGQLRN